MAPAGCAAQVLLRFEVDCANLGGWTGRRYNQQVMMRVSDPGGSWAVSDYRQANGRSPVRAFLSRLDDADFARAAALV